jgi:hypothetical protein
MRAWFPVVPAFAVLAQCFLASPARAQSPDNTMTIEALFTTEQLASFDDMVSHDYSGGADRERFEREPRYKSVFERCESQPKACREFLDLQISNDRRLSGMTNAIEKALKEATPAAVAGGGYSLLKYSNSANKKVAEGLLRSHGIRPTAKNAGMVLRVVKSPLTKGVAWLAMIGGAAYFITDAAAADEDPQLRTAPLPHRSYGLLRFIEDVNLPLENGSMPPVPSDPAKLLE